MTKKIKLVFNKDPAKIHLPDGSDLYSASDYCLDPLEENISKNGIITPIIVRVDEKGQYELVCGKKRLICARLLRMKSVPCIKLNCTSRQAAVLRLSESLSVKGENCFETADSMQNLITEHNMSTAKIAESLGISENAVKEKLKLLDFPFELRQKAADNLSESQMLSLMLLPNNKISAAMDEIIHNGLNDKQTKEYIASFFSAEKKAPVRKAAISDLKLFSNSIEKLLYTIQNAGYETDFSMTDEERYIDFRIKVKKRGEMLDPVS